MLGALFSSASSVLGSLPQARLMALSETVSGRRRDAIRRYVSNPARVEARWLVLRVLGLSLGAIGFFRESAEPAWLAMLIGVGLTYVLPSAVGGALLKASAERAAPALLACLRPVEWLAIPLAWPLVWIDAWLNRPAQAGERDSDGSITETEMEYMIHEGEMTGALGHDQSEMIRNVLDFRDVQAGDVMLPRLEVAAIEADTPIEKVLRLVVEDGYSRYPVYRERIDNVVGFLHVKDLVGRMGKPSSMRGQASDLMRTPVVYVPETQSASSVLADMRSGHKHHIAIVIDEFGGMAGIITLEDIIERIVGDIRDEHDDPEEPPAIEKLPDGRLMVDARVPVAELSRHLGTELPEDGDYYSLGGLMLERMGRVPTVGEQFTAQGHVFTVRAADERHVEKVEIQLLEAGDASELPGKISLRPRPAA